MCLIFGLMRLVSPALFVLVGILYERCNTKFVAYLSGSGAVMPMFSIMFLLFSTAYGFWAYARVVHGRFGPWRTFAGLAPRFLRLWLRGWSTTPSFLGLFSLPAAPPARLGSAFGSGLSVGSVIWLILRQPRPSSA